MADISQEISDFRSAVYGEEVRGSMISLAEKLNGVCEANEDTVNTHNTEIASAIANANTAATSATSAAASATTAAGSANGAAGSANTAATNATNAAAAASSTNSGIQQAEAARVTAEQARVAAERARVSAESERATAESARANAETNRTTNESARQENEGARSSAETSRVQAEATRSANETARAGAETNRVNAEQNRATAFRAIQDVWGDMERQVIPPATTSTLGGVIVGQGLSVDANGTLSFEAGNFETVDHAEATYATIATVAGKANSTHVHAATDVTTGVFPVARGGTGVTTAAAERERLGLGSSTGPLPVANGGTGASTAAAARTNLGVYATGDVDTALAGKAAASHTHAASDIVSDQLAIANGGTGADTAADALTNLGAASASDVSDLQEAIGDVDVATDGDLQTQIDALGDSVSPTSPENVPNPFTAASGFSIGSCTVFVLGKHAHLYLTGTMGASSAGWKTVGTIKAGYRPKFDTFGVGHAPIGTAADARVNANGAVGIYSSSSAAVSVRVTMGYFLP